MPYLNSTDFAKVRQAIDDVLDSTKPIGEVTQALNDAARLVSEAEAAVASPELCEQARDLHGSDDIEIDDEGAGTSTADTGTWVQAWVFVRNKEEDDGNPTQ